MSEPAQQPRPAEATPAKRKTIEPPVLFERTQLIIEQLDEALGEPVLTYWNSTKGSICQNDVAGLYGLLQRIGRVDRLCLLIKSDGGSGQAALRMVNLLRQYVKHLTVLAPFECQSAATMLALGADKIQMGPLAHLSAVDTSLTHDLSPIDRDNDRVSVSQDELQRVVALWQKQAKDTTAPTPTNSSSSTCTRWSSAPSTAPARSPPSSAERSSPSTCRTRKRRSRSANILNSDYPSHNYPITLREASASASPSNPWTTESARLLFEFNEIYSEMGQSAYHRLRRDNSHDNSILNVLESRGLLVYFQLNKDWHYRADERRWVAMNDKSGWKRAQLVDGAVSVSTFHIR